MINKKTFLAMCVFFIISTSISDVFASGIAVFHSKNDQGSNMELEYLDRNTIRMNINQRGSGSSYMLVHDGKAYTVTTQRGKTHVMDMASLGGMAKNMGAGADASFSQELLSVKQTDRKETIAGFKGDVYSLTWKDNKGTHTTDAVLSSHKNVREFSDAWMGMAETMARSMSTQPITDTSIWHFLEKEGKGMLRFGDDFIVTSIVSKNMSENRFILPAKPMQMPDFGKMFSRPK